MEHDTSTRAPCAECAINRLIFELLDAEVGTLRRQPDGMTGFLILVNDAFAYACGDAEEVPRDRIAEVRAIWQNAGNLGLIAWVAARRGMKPLVEVREAMEAAGVALAPGLKDNPENAGGRRWHTTVMPGNREYR